MTIDDLPDDRCAAALALLRQMRALTAAEPNIDLAPHEQAADDLVECGLAYINIITIADDPPILMLRLKGAGNDNDAESDRTF